MLKCWTGAGTECGVSSGSVLMRPYTETWQLLTGYKWVSSAFSAAANAGAALVYEVLMSILHRYGKQLQGSMPERRRCTRAGREMSRRTDGRGGPMERYWRGQSFPSRLKDPVWELEHGTGRVDISWQILSAGTFIHSSVSVWRGHRLSIVHRIKNMQPLLLFSPSNCFYLPLSTSLAPQDVFPSLLKSFFNYISVPLLCSCAPLSADAGPVSLLLLEEAQGPEGGCVPCVGAPRRVGGYPGKCAQLWWGRWRRAGPGEAALPVCFSPLGIQKC